MQKKIESIIKDSIGVKQNILESKEIIEQIELATKAIIEAYQNNKKVLFCGNGGSAADAQHLAAELSGRFYFDRPPLYAEALHVNSSYVTAVGNDYSYDDIYSRYLKGCGAEGDILVGISTSGNSKNVLNAFKVAQNINMKVIAFTGESGGKLKTFADILINVPSNDTPRIQESHILIGHIICELVEKKLFSK